MTCPAQHRSSGPGVRHGGGAGLRGVHLPRQRQVGGQASPHHRWRLRHRAGRRAGFAREGADGVISYLPEEEDDAKETARVVREAGRRCVTAPGDVREESYCRQLVERTVSELGGIDVLVSNAAYQMAIEGIEDLSTEQLMRTHTPTFSRRLAVQGGG